MTEHERLLLQKLVAASCPLPFQLLGGLAFVTLYWSWSQTFYRAVDPRLREWIGRRVGARVVWVLRRSKYYRTLFDFNGYPRYAYWSWGIAAEADRTFFRDALVAISSLVLVNGAAAIWPIALLLLAGLWLRALSYVVFVPCLLAGMAIYSIFWDGRREVAGMERWNDAPQGAQQ